MADEQAVETGQFSFSGQTQDSVEGFADLFEPGQIEQLNKHGRLFIVTDGMAGAASGHAACRYAAKKILHDYYRSSEADLEKRLMAVIRKTNLEIIDRNKQFPKRRPMAINLLAALIHQNKLWVASVGDGRVYVVWDQDIERLAAVEDEPVETTEGEKKAAADQDKPDDGPRQPGARGLGLDEQYHVSVFARRLFPGDTIVLASGGLAGYVTEDEIAKTMTRYPPTQASRRLAEMAGRRGSRDIISISVTRLQTRPVSQAALQAKPLPSPPPDWESLVKPEVKSQAVGSRPVTPQLIGGSYTMERTRWGRPVRTILIWLLIVLLGLAAFAGWRYWQVANESQVAAVPAATTESEGESEPVGSEVTAANPTEGGSLVAEPNSPLSPVATPQAASATVAGMSAGETISPGSQPSRTVTPVTVAAVPSPTPLPTINVPAGCENRGRFAGDVTVSDGEEFAPGEPFEKIWLVSNYGDCPWGPGYTVRYIDGDRMSGEGQPVTEVIEPEAMGRVAVQMIAPEEGGTYRGTWQLHSLDGEPFGPELFVEIEVSPDAFSPAAVAEANTLYNFITGASQASWSARDVSYTVTNADINRNLVIPFPEGMVAIGSGEFGADYGQFGTVMLTHPHQELGFIEGTYAVSESLQPTDALVAVLGFPKAAIINDDGATFEVTFTPVGGTPQSVLSRLVTYDEGPVALQQPLSGIAPGQTGVFTVRVSGGNSLSYDWATWLDLRVIRP